MNAYPILSVELMHLDALGQRLTQPGQVERLTHDLMLRLESQLTAQQAIIESIHGNVLFFSFRDNGDLKTSLAKAFKVGMSLTRKTIPIQGIDLQLRAGLDILPISEKNPVAAVPERMVAQPGQLVVSQAVYQLTQKHLTYEAIGPIKVQGSLKTFFRLAGQEAPAAPAPKPSAPAPAPPPAEPVPAQATQPQPQAPTPAPAQAQAQPAAQAPAPKPPAAKPHATSPAGTGGPVLHALAPEAPVEPVTRKLEPLENPGAINYEPPALIVLSTTPKTPNIAYAQALEAFETDIHQSLTAAPQSPGRIIGLCGGDSIGKSAILGMTLSKFPADSFHWLGGNFFEHLSGNQFPLSYWLEMVQNRFGMPLDGVPQDEGTRFLANLLSDFYGGQLSPETVDFMESLLCLRPLAPISPDIRPRLGRMIPEIQGFLERMIQEKPVVLVMEDLQYADAASLELLIQLLQRDLLKDRITILLTYTPDVVFTGPFQQVLSMLPFKEYVLDRTDETTLTDIAQPPLGVPWKKLPDALRAQLMEKGSPMYLEEAFRWLLLRGGFSIHAKTGKFMPEKNLKKLRVPETLQDLIEDRFGALDDMSRSVLQIASVLGERFSTDMLSNMSPLAEKFEDVLQFLWQNGFIVPDTGNLIRFRHRLLWHVSYQSMDPEARRKQHQLVSDYLEKAKAVGFSVNPIVLARHQQQARQTEAAMASWHQAGSWLAHVGSVTGANIAFRHVQRLTKSLPESDHAGQMLRLYETLALLNLDVYPDYARNLLLTCLHLGEAVSPEARIQLQLFLAQTYEHLGAYPHLTSTLQRVLDALPQNGFALERIAIGSQLTWFLYVQGSFQEARHVYAEFVAPLIGQAGQSAWEDGELRHSVIRGELARARMAIFQCEANTLDIIEEALVQCDLYNEHEMSLQLRVTRCLHFLLKGNTEICERDLQPLLQQIERLPNPAPVMAWWGLVVLHYHWMMEDWQNAAMLLPNTSYQAEQARDYLAWCMCQCLAGAISMGTGQRGEAQTLLEKAVTLSAQYHLSQSALLGWQLISDNEVALNHYDVADQVCARALEIAQKPNIRNMYAFYQLILSQAGIHLARKAYKQAGALLEKHWPAMVKTGYLPLMADAAYSISQLYGAMSQDLPEPHRSRYQAQQQNFSDKAKTLWQEQRNDRRLQQLTQAEQRVMRA